MTPGVSNLNIGSQENRFQTIFTNNLDIKNYILYRESFTLSTNTIMSINNYNLIFDTVDFQNDFNVENNYYIFEGNYSKYLLNINLIYQWIDSEYPQRFIIGIYIYRQPTNNMELIFNTLVGLDDFQQNIGLFSKKVKIEINTGDKLYINLFKNNQKNLQINKNSNMIFELFS